MSPAFTRSESWPLPPVGAVAVPTPLPMTFVVSSIGERLFENVAPPPLVPLIVSALPASDFTVPFDVLTAWLRCLYAAAA